MTSSLIITTYNRPDALKLCLFSILKLTQFPDEIIIADDGSTHTTASLIEEFRQQLSIPLRHVWQVDNGFRAARSRNNAVALAQGDYVIMIDGDLILEKHFIADHLRLARPGYYLKGGRCKLSQSYTDSICKNAILPSLYPWNKGILRRGLNLVHCYPLAFVLSSHYRKNKIGVLGCNQSVWREDYLAINGFDEDFHCWGGEDSDFIRRLKAHGIKTRHLKFAGCAAHLWHPENFSERSHYNLEYGNRPITETDIICKNGVSRAIAQLKDIDKTSAIVVYPE